MIPRQLIARRRVSRALRERALQHLLDTVTAEPIPVEEPNGTPIREGIRAWG